MEELRVKIYVDDRNEKFGNNKFVLGKLVGYIECISKTFMRDENRMKRYGIQRIKDGRILRTIVTKEELEELTAMINRAYSDLCTIMVVKGEEL